MKTWSIIVICFLFVFGAIGYYAFAAKFEYARNSYVQEQYKAGNAGGVLDFYFNGDPIIESRRFVGNDTPVTMIVVTDFLSGASASFFNDLFPQIKEQFIDSGQARLYEKYYITRQEYDQKKGRFIYAVAALCFEDLKQPAPAQFAAFHQELFALASRVSQDPKSPGNISSEDVASLAERAASLGVPKQAFLECMHAQIGAQSPWLAQASQSSESSLQTPSASQSPSAPSLPSTLSKILYEDMIEVDMLRVEGPSLHIGIDGGDNTVFLGLPSIAQVKSALRQKQITIGI